MPFVEINVKNEIEKQRQNNPEFKKAWDESRAEYKLIGEMISLRKQENITQNSIHIYHISTRNECFFNRQNNVYTENS